MLYLTPDDIRSLQLSTLFVAVGAVLSFWLADPVYLASGTAGALAILTFKNLGLFGRYLNLPNQPRRWSNGHAVCVNCKDQASSRVKLHECDQCWDTYCSRCQWIHNMVCPDHE